MTTRRVKPTIRDVAAKAGVSLATVSYVLSGRSGGTTRISEPTKEKVLGIAQELGYVPNQAARGMRRGRTDLVAVAVGNLDWPWDRAIAETAARILPEYGYQPLVLLGATAWRDFMLAGGADGVIIGYVPDTVVEDRTVTELARRGVPQVVVSEVMQPDGFDVVVPETASGIAEAMEQLTSRHSRIACIGRSGDSPIRHGSCRFSDFEAGMERAGLAIDSTLVTTAENQGRLVYDQVLAMLQRPDRPTAIFACDDQEALSALRAAYRLGLSVPEDVEIIGVGNSKEGLESDPPLSSVGPEPILEQVVNLLVARLQGSAPPQGVRRAAPWRLYNRGTTLVPSVARLSAG
jgi:LacI family transcriptional regulator